MFTLDEKQKARLDEWVKEQDQKVATSQGEKYPYYGAIGGAYTYSFTPTSVGVALIVKNCVTGAELDLSFYADW